MLATNRFLNTVYVVLGFYLAAVGGIKAASKARPAREMGGKTCAAQH